LQGYREFALNEMVLLGVVEERFWVHEGKGPVTYCMVGAWYDDLVQFRIGLRTEEVSEGSVPPIREDEGLVPHLLIVGHLTKLLDVVSRLNVAKVHIIGDPHIFQSLKEKAFLQLPLGKDPDEKLLLKVVSEQGE
jgi:hypothetical protein